MLSVYVIHYNAPERCRATVLSLTAQTGVAVQVTVVHNGGPRPVLPDGVRLVETGRNLGYTGAANMAIEDWQAHVRSANDMFAIACHDVALPATAVAALGSFLDLHPRCGVVAPAVVQSDIVAGQAVAGGSPTLRSGPVDCSWVSGAFLLIRPACARAVGDFDERLGSYCEDVDYCIRARAAGWGIVMQTDVVARGEGSSSSNWRRLMYRNSVLVVLKHSGRRAAARSLLGLCAAALLALIHVLSPRTAGSERLVWRARALNRLAAVPSVVLAIARRDF